MQVIKRDGSKENFDGSKIERVVLAAGLDSKKAKTLSENIRTWAENCGKENITSLEIRDKVEEQLKDMDENVYSLFNWYQKTKTEDRSPQI